MNSRKTCVLIVIAVLIALTQIVGYADTQTMMEIDEVSESGYLSLSSADIDCRFPIRVGEVGTGSDNFTRITAPYNEPRTTYAHTGTDFSAANGTNLYGAYSNGEVYEVDNIANDVLGKHVRVQYKHTENNNDYYFQSLYAHLSSMESIGLGDTVGITTKLGDSGNTGSSSTNYPYHLHMDFRGASSTYGTDDTCRYPTNWFYQSASDSNDMAFINRTQASTSTVEFRCVSQYSSPTGGDYSAVPNSVVFYYKADGASSWATASSNLITTSADGKTFTISIDSLYNNYMYYYFKADTDSWSVGNCQHSCHFF